MRPILLAYLSCSFGFAIGAGLQKPIAPAPPASISSGNAPPPYRDRLLTLHKSLVEIESISGNENEAAHFLVEYLTQHHYQAAHQLLPPPLAGSPIRRRYNVVAWPGPEARTPPAARLLLTSHLDVVPPYLPYGIDADPDEVTNDTVIHGRGSVDAKASVAAQIIALEELRRSGEVEEGDVMLLYVVGEETTGDGMRHFSESSRHWSPPPQFEAAIFGEPTENKLACGHKGHISCTVRAKGKAGHSGYPWLGKSANEVLMRGLLAVVDADLGSSKLFGNTTVNVGVLDGGVAANVIPESAMARLAIRVATGPQHSGHEIARERMGEVLKGIDSEALTMNCENGYGALECNCDVEGFETITVNYGTDVPNLVGNHTRYLYGPGNILVAHSDHEALTVDDLETAVEGYKTLIKHALNAS